MRKLFSTLMLIALLAIVSAGAMAQNSFSYQSVIRNNGQVVSNQDVALLISILSGNDVCYQEVQKVKTNAYGNISISVGEGEPKTGSFAAIPWESMSVMMQIEVSTDGTENYVNLGQMQIQPVPYTMYAARTTTVIQPKEASEDPIFEVRDSEGELLFAVYETGVKVFVDGNDNQSGKAAKSKFAVAGQSGSKGERNLLTIDADGTTVYVDENTNTDANKAAKSRFAVAGQSGKDFNNLLTIDGSGATIYVDENTDTDANKAAKSRFAVAGQSGKDGGNLLTIDAEGTTVYVDENTDTDANKAAKSRFAVAGQSGKDFNNLLTIDGSGATIYVDENTNTDTNKAAKSRFAVAGQSGGKANGNLFTIDGDGSTVYVDFNTSDKAAKSRFAVAGQSGKGIENALTIDGDQATFYIDVDDDTNTDDNAKAAKSRFAVAGQSGKDVQTAFVVDGSGTIIYIDEWDDASKAAKSTFAVAGLSSQKANSNFFIINRDSTRIYVNDQPQTADTTGTEPGSAPVVAPSLASAFAVIGMTQKTDMIVVNRDSTIVKMNTYVEEEVQNSTGKVEKIIDDSKPKTIYTTGQIAAIALKGNDEVGDSYTITYAYYQSDNGEYLHLRYCDDYNNYQYRNYYLIDNVLYADSIFMSSAVSEFAIAPEHYTQPVKSDTSLLMVYERKMRNNGYSSFLEDGQTTFYDSEENLVMTTEHNVLIDVDNGKSFIDTTLQNILVQGMILPSGASYERNDFVKLQLSNGQLYDNATDFDNCNEDVFGSEEERNKLTVTQIESWFAALKAGFTVKGLANNDVYGEVRFSENKERYAYGETLTLTADAKEGYIFTCWSDGFPDKERSVIVAGEASYQAIFEQPVLYVSGSKNAKNENYGFTIAEPLATLAAAASIIVEAEPTYLKWTIRVDSAVTGSQTLPADLNDHASSITIEGYRGINRDGVPQDTLNGNSEGTTLKINTAVPVTIENLMITKGYAEEANGGGIYISEGATVTLAGGACISGNRATPIIENNQPVNGKGGGVYTAGTLVIDGGVVGDKNAKNNATNTDYSNYANRGGGIYFSNTGKVTVKEGAVIAYNFGYQGGGISTYEIGDAELTIDGGEIRYNGCDPKPQQATASNKFNSYGGGLFLVGCKFVLSGGSIHHNFGCDGGGGLFLQGTNDATMSGGSIHNNTWDEEGYKRGSDVLLYDGCTLSMTSGSIYADNAVSIGVMSRTNTTSLKMRGDATISQNTPVYLADSTYINITGPLTAGIAAIITPQTYANNRTVLALAEGVTTTTLAAEVGKFKLASTDWRIIADGKMLKTDFVSVEGTYFDGSQRVDTSHVFIVGRKLAIHNLYACDHEVTQSEYEAVMRTNPSYFNSNPVENEKQENRPVEQVNWYDALVYCNKLSINEGLTPCYSINGVTNPETWGEAPTAQNAHWDSVVCNFNANGYRLPTEAEWEYLAREGNKFSTYKFSGSDTISVVAWYGMQISNGTTHEVKKLKPNSLGLYDMCGNVWEWCWDKSDWINGIEGPGGKVVPVTEDTPFDGESTGVARTGRGGCWSFANTLCGIAYRHNNHPNYKYQDVGFRIVRTAVITDSVTITFNTNDSEPMEPMKVWRGYRHNELPTPKKGTLNFGGWYIDSDCQIPFVVGGAITSDTTLYAKWLSDFIEVPGTYFDGSTTVANSVVFVEGSKFTIQDLLVCDHEVTQNEWKNVMSLKDEDISDAYGQGDNKPIYNVTWYQAIAYCNKLSLRDSLEPVYSVSEVTDWNALKFADIPKDSTKWNAVTCNFNANGYRLPTEAEWEYLARGGSNWDNYRYSGSDNIAEVGWYFSNSPENNQPVMHDVKTKNANSLGLYDMSGNAWEWCWDLNGSGRILRGGSLKCKDAIDSPNNDWCNVSKRATQYASVMSIQLGFRVVRMANFSIYIDVANGDNSHSGLTPNNALADLTAAVSLIETTAKPALDYIIYISGTINGAQTLDAEHLNGKANSVTLCGLNGFDGDGVPQDMLDGKGSGTALTVATTVPVEIRNLKITGGNAENGGGINIASCATVTLADGAMVCGNSTTYGENHEGGGIYNAGTLFMYGSAMVGSDTAITAAVSRTACSNAACHGGGLYNAPGAKAYLGYSSENTPARLTGGFYNNYSWGEAGAIYNKGILKMGSGNISYNGSEGYSAGVTNNYSEANFELNGGTISHNATNPNKSEMNSGGVRACEGNFIMRGGEISYNSSNSSGGVRVHMGSTTLIGGVIKNNTATTGQGIYFESGTLEMGGSIVVEASNDVYLSYSNKISICKEFDIAAYVAVITPSSYSTSKQVLSAANGITLSDWCGMFAVKPVVSGTTSTSWFVNNTGYLQQGESHTFVDLGLTSGNLWATCNVGATNPQDYGDYFAWGETETYYSSLNPLAWKDGKENGYAWASYTKLSGGSQNTFKKYNRNEGYGIIDNKNDLDPEDDAATANWGFGWATPTSSDYQELINECDWSWTTYNGIVGYTVTSRKNNAQIFIPAAGGFGENSTVLGNTGENGFYWTASLWSDGVSATHLNFGSYAPYTPSYPRVDGFPVRPVKKH